MHGPFSISPFVISSGRDRRPPLARSVRDIPEVQHFIAVCPQGKISKSKLITMRLLTANKTSFSRGNEVLNAFIGLRNNTTRNVRVCGQCRYNSSVAGLFMYDPSFYQTPLIHFKQTFRLKLRMLRMQSAPKNTRKMSGTTCHNRLLIPSLEVYIRQ